MTRREGQLLDPRTRADPSVADMDKSPERVPPIRQVARELRVPVALMARQAGLVDRREAR